MLEVPDSVLLFVWHGTSVYMSFVSFLSVYSSVKGEGEKASVPISLLAYLNNYSSNKFYRPLLDSIIMFDEEDAG